MKTTDSFLAMMMLNKGSDLQQNQIKKYTQRTTSMFTKSSCVHLLITDLVFLTTDREVSSSSKGKKKKRIHEPKHTLVLTCKLPCSDQRNTSWSIKQLSVVCFFCSCCCFGQLQGGGGGSLSRPPHEHHLS